MKATLLLSAFVLAACATLPSNAPPFSLAPKADAGKGLVYVYRVGAYPTRRSPDVMIDKRPLFSPPEKAYTWVHLPVGLHRVTVEWASDIGCSDSVKVVEVAGGEPLFIKLSGSFEQTGVLSSKIESKLTRIPPAEAVRDLHGCCRYLPAETRF
jgi:hypothetical protein